jgi:hypothetical protein
MKKRGETLTAQVCAEASQLQIFIHDELLGSKMPLPRHRSVKPVKLFFVIIGCAAEGTSYNAARNAFPGHRKLGIISSFAPIPFAALNSWGILKVLGVLYKPLSPLGKAITDNGESWIKLSAYYVSVTIAGLLSQLPWGQVAAQMNDGSDSVRAFYFALKLVGVSGVPIYSLLSIIEDIKRQRNPVTKFLQIAPSELEARLQSVKNLIIASCETGVNHYPSLSLEDRLDAALLQFRGTYATVTPQQNTNRLIAAVFARHKKVLALQTRKLTYPRNFFKTSVAVLTPVLLYQLGGLTDLIISSMSSSYFLRAPMIGLAIGCGGYLAVKMPIDATGSLFNKLAGKFSGAVPKTFGEEFHPRTTALIEFLGVLLSCTTVGLMNAIGEEVFSKNTPGGRFCIYSTILLYTLQVIDAIFDEINDSIEACAHSSDRTDIQDNLKMREILSDLKEIIQKSKYIEFANFLDRLDPALKEELMRGIMSSQELDNYFSRGSMKERLVSSDEEAAVV